MIGIDLLSVSDTKQILSQLGRLEWLQYSSVDDLKSDLKEMERFLEGNSPYYRKEIGDKTNKCDEFLDNFIKLKVTPKNDGEFGLGSWPHFLFNICGASSRPEQMPLEIRLE